MHRAVLACIVLWGCGSAQRPISRSTRLGTPRQMAIDDVPGRGFVVDVNGSESSSGELLAVHPDAIYVLQEDGIRRISREGISLVWIDYADGEDIRVTRALLDQLYQYARFPQGMPAAWLPSQP